MRTIISILIGVALACAAVFGLSKCGFSDYFAYEVKAGNPSLDEVTTAEKLKVLTVSDEIMVTRTKAKSEGKLGFLRSKIGANEAKICAIYPAIANIGFDLAKVDKNKMIQPKGDSLIIFLPAVEILNKDGKTISESEVKFPIQNGDWSNAELGELAKQANADMLQKCQTEEFFTMAADQGRRIMKTTFESLGFNKVRVEVMKQGEEIPTLAAAPMPAPASANEAAPEAAPAAAN